MRHRANRAALIQHPDHFAASAIDIDKTPERALVAEVGHLAEAQAQGLATCPADEGAYFVPIRFGQCVGDDDDFATMDVALSPREDRVAGRRRHRAVGIEGIRLLRAHRGK